MTRLIIGAMVRAIGAYPSGWRYPGAHRDPRGDAAVLRHAARGGRGGAARLPLLRRLARDRPRPRVPRPVPRGAHRPDRRRSPTSRASPSTSGSSRPPTRVTPIPYTLARATASIDLLSGGRAGLNLVTGAEPRAAGNHGADFHAVNETRYDRAVEFDQVLRRLWDSFEDDAIVADAATGVFLDPPKLHATDFHGRAPQRRPVR